MKHFGCILEFTRLRNLDLMRAYRYLVEHLPVVSVDSLGTTIAEMPSARFWISEERAAVVISQVLRGSDILSGMRPRRREMFEEMIRRYHYLAERMPNAKPFDIVCAVVNSPAPKFYMSPRTATETIYKIKSGFYEHYCNRADNQRERPAK